MSVQVGAHYLEKNDGGQGIMLGGISGIPPATVVILGAGITAEYAARTALGYGAQVFVMDNDLAKLRHLENALDRRIITATANYQYLSSALQYADVVIGAALFEGERAPVLVTEPMVASMKQGSVIVDTVIDQGGCIATSKATTHSNPTYMEHGVIHYCVPNIPSNVARTATYALNNVIVPYLLAIGDAGGIRECLWTNTALRNGTYVYKKHLTKKSLSKIFDMPYREIEMLIASQI
jgi:alanine dehydrogenase